MSIFRDLFSVGGAFWDNVSLSLSPTNCAVPSAHLPTAPPAETACYNRRRAKVRDADAFSPPNPLLIWRSDSRGGASATDDGTHYNYCAERRLDGAVCGSSPVGKEEPRT